MAFEIVDGMTGTKHISSDDLSALNIATIGESNCVLNYGDNFKLTMTNANTATLGTGVGMVGGKRFWNQAATSLTIQSGAQGQKRNDLIVARYARTSAGIESITPVVVKGAPSTGTAADPDVTTNDMKLWRIPIDGINAGTPVKLFDEISSLATLRDSVSQYTTKTFTTPNKTVKYGDVVDIDVSVNIDGYTPVCVTGVWSNHAGSCCITQFGLRDNEKAFATVKNLELVHQGTWTDLKLSITVLYRKSIA